MRRKVATPLSSKETFWWKKKAKKEKNIFVRMYLTIPVTSTTSKRTFSAHRRLKNHLRSTMKEGCLDICLLMHCHKSVTDTLDTVKIACLNEEPHFKTFLRLCLCIHLFICLCCWYEMQCQRLFQLLFNKLTQSRRIGW